MAERGGGGGSGPRLRFLTVMTNVTRHDGSGGGGKEAPEILDTLLKRRFASGDAAAIARSHDGVLAGLVETLLLARCSALVGKFSSGLFRLAYALSAAHKGGLPPYLSLDAPWCVDYGLPAVFNDEFPSRGPDADADGGGHGGGAATEQVVVTTAQAPGGRGGRGGEARGVVRRPFLNVCPC